MTFCPCCSGKTFDACCQPFLEGWETPAHPELLMRSRYSAFCLKRSTYLIDTLAPEKRATPMERAELGKSIMETFSDTAWLGLRVVEEKMLSPHTATVEFAAFYKRQGRLGQIHELSRFVLNEGIWYYTEGTFLPDLTLGRNDLCFCGSGKKYKRCHGVNP